MNLDRILTETKTDKNVDINKIENLDFINEQISKYPLLNKEEETLLFIKSQKGDIRAREKIINSNLGLAITSTTKIYKKTNTGILTFYDIIQIANLALIEAVDTFDLNKGCRFSTYATNYIEYSIYDALEVNSDLINVSYRIKQKISKIKKFKDLYYSINNCYPSDEVIANEFDLTPLELKKYMLYDYKYVSLSDRVNKGKDVFLGELLKDESISFEREVCNKLYIEELHKIIKCVLTEREEKIIKFRYGIYDGKERTLEEVGKIIGLNRERIRQIEKNALNKLKNVLKLKNMESRTKYLGVQK